MATSPHIRVHLLPAHVEPAALRGGVAVVLDVLRASTTIVHALAAGAARVIPCESIEEARRRAASLSANAILGGERGGTRIDGFQLGNSPLEYTAKAVGGRSVVFTTTNGTRALARCREADRVLIGAFVNLSSVITALDRDDRAAHVVCAGTEGRISAEDVLCAGAIVDGIERSRLGRRLGKQDADSLGATVDRIEPSQGNDVEIDDVSRIARDFWRIHATRPDGLLTVLRESHGGRNLVELGYDADIARAAERDLFDIAPEHFPEVGEIRAAGGTHGRAP